MAAVPHCGQVTGPETNGAPGAVGAAGPGAAAGCAGGVEGTGMSTAPH
jgi:hypothetical protein